MAGRIGLLLFGALVQSVVAENAPYAQCKSLRFSTLFTAMLVPCVVHCEFGGQGTRGGIYWFSSHLVHLIPVR